MKKSKANEWSSSYIRIITKPHLTSDTKKNLKSFKRRNTLTGRFSRKLVHASFSRFSSLGGSFIGLELDIIMKSHVYTVLFVSCLLLCLAISEVEMLHRKFFRFGRGLQKKNRVPVFENDYDDDLYRDRWQELLHKGYLNSPQVPTDDRDQRTTRN
ncbi:predicted protein [Nematostella vectensis]|uniref:Uncharacterized protein n=1 Tax=Nematostella vectensis TaxID=45351 RepID=A7S3P6_NEMVE|nr:predicted protein [Nematostella vectensis]|eukprot:XP_001633737.1 predicted protein [Nematostella vectensis]